MSNEVPVAHEDCGTTEKDMRTEGKDCLGYYTGSSSMMPHSYSLETGGTDPELLA